MDIRVRVHLAHFWKMRLFWALFGCSSTGNNPQFICSSWLLPLLNWMLKCLKRAKFSNRDQNILNGLSFILDVQSEIQILNGIYETSSSSSTNIHYRICNSGWSFFACVLCRRIINWTSSWFYFRGVGMNFSFMN